MPPAALLLAPGAGADSSQAQLVAIDEAVSALGWVVTRMDFPYRLAGRRAPDRPPVLLEAVRDAAASLAERSGVPADRIVLGGRSMGGRICSLAVAGGLPAAGLVLVSYPLHPPGRLDKQAERTAHFPSLRIPCLFVSGTRDSFGSRDELEEATRAIPGPVQHLWIEGGDHALRGRNVPVAGGIMSATGSFL
ncbi:MAG: alpha/beta family hydrolase [Acidimicrobiales bacterium]